jgi:thymidylate kinase
VAREAGSALAGSGSRGSAPVGRPVHPRVHPGLEAAFAAFDDSKVTWCLLRGEDKLADPRGDIDLLIAASDMPAARRTLLTAGYVEERSWGIAPHRPFLGFDPVTGTWLKLDVVTGLAFGRHAELPLPGADGILARSRRDGVVSVPAPEDAFWLLLLHALLDKRSVGDAYRARAEELAPLVLDSARGAEAGSPARFVNDLGVDGWNAASIAETVARGEWTSMGTVSSALRAAWRRKDPVRSRTIVAWRALARRAGWRLGLIPTGVTVAVLGPDGAGKSTLIETLQGAFPVKAQGIYMGLYKRQVRMLPGVGLVGRTMLQFSRYVRGRYHRARGRVVLFDRYTFDALVQEHDAPGWKTRIHTSMLAHAAPAPDLTLVLDLPGDSMHARKGERDPETLERMRRGYLRLAERPDVELLDAAEPAAEVARKATALIWAAIAAGSRGRR